MSLIPLEFVFGYFHRHYNNYIIDTNTHEFLPTLSTKTQINSVDVSRTGNTSIIYKKFYEKMFDYDYANGEYCITGGFMLFNGRAFLKTIINNRKYWVCVCMFI